MKTAVIYKSKSGFVKKYAEWIKEELKADIFEGHNLNFKDLEQYNTLIFGGGLYAAGINGIKVMKMAVKEYPEKNIIIFASGASPFRQEIYDEIFLKNFTSEERNKIKFFYMRGGFDYSRCTFFDKILMNVLKFSLKRKKEMTADERGMLNAYDTPIDFTRKENTKPIIDYIKELEQSRKR